MGLDGRLDRLCEQEGPYPRNLPRLPEILGIAFEAAPYDSRVIESQALRKPDVLPPLLNRGRITETALPARARALVDLDAGC